MADHGTLGHFLPYLLKQRLRAVLWPAAGERRGFVLLFGALGVFYGLGLAYMLNHRPSGRINWLFGINGILFLSTLLVDFLPVYRPVQRPLPEHFPVSARYNVLTVFLLDLITLRRVVSALFLVVALLGAPQFGWQLGLSLGVLVSATTTSFNLRLLLSLGRWRHSLFWLNVACLLAAGAWLGGALLRPLLVSPAMVAVLGPLVLWAAALALLGGEFSARYLPVRYTEGADDKLLARLSPEWKVYLRKTWSTLVMGLVLKILMMGACGLLIAKGGKDTMVGVFYVSFLPITGFTYVNNNLFGNVGVVTNNELSRLGLTARVLRLYLRIVVPVLLLDCLISVLLLLTLFPRDRWPLLWLLPLVGGVCLALGLWSSLYKAKFVHKAIDFANMRNNNSTMMNLLTTGTSVLLCFLPWWASVGVGSAVILSTWIPVQRVLRNDGVARRRLWRALSS